MYETIVNWVAGFVVVGGLWWLVITEIRSIRRGDSENDGPGMPS